MKLTKETYRKMNAAYNTIFDEWQKIEEMDPAVFNQLNTALVLLDGVLDALKAEATDSASEEKKADAPDTTGFKVF